MSWPRRCGLVRPGGELVALAPKDRGGARWRRAGGLRLRGQRKAPPTLASALRAASRPRGLDEGDRGRRPADSPRRSASGRSPACSAGTGSIRAAPCCWRPSARQAGAGADLGCGVGLLAGAFCRPGGQHAHPHRHRRRAIAAARRNIDDPRAEFLHARPAAWQPRLSRPRLRGHEPAVPRAGGAKIAPSAQAFVAAAAAMLRTGGVLPPGRQCRPALRGSPARSCSHFDDQSSRQRRLQGSRGAPSEAGPARPAAGQSRLWLAARGPGLIARRRRSSWTASRLRVADQRSR